MEYLILVINPGSTSTKIAVFKNDKLFFKSNIEHLTEEINKYPTIVSQYDFRKEMIIDSLEKNNINLHQLSCVCGRGGMLKPLESGTYLINQDLLNDLKISRYGEHASNLGAILAYDIAKDLNIPSFIVDPVSVDEMLPIARISGMPEINRLSLFHALNHKAIARQVANDVGKRYEDMNLVIAHLGGGISVAAHYQGKVIDVNNALDGDGPMSPERSGTVPLGPLYKMCFSGNYTLKQIKQMNYGQGGLVAYLKTNDAKSVVDRIAHHDKEAQLIYDAMIYQIAKEIGAYATVLKGSVDFIVLTGGLAYENYLVTQLSERTKFIAKVLVYPGENEMLSLAQGALRILNQTEKAKIYQ